MAGFRNPESSALEYRIQPKESGIPLKIEIGNSIFTDKVYFESGIHSVESRIQYCVGFPYIGRLPSEEDQATCLVSDVFPVPLDNSLR